MVSYTSDGVRSIHTYKTYTVRTQNPTNLTNVNLNMNDPVNYNKGITSLSVSARNDGKGYFASWNWQLLFVTMPGNMNYVQSYINSRSSWEGNGYADGYNGLKDKDLDSDKIEGSYSFTQTLPYSEPVFQEEKYLSQVVESSDPVYDEDGKFLRYDYKYTAYFNCVYTQTAVNYKNETSYRGRIYYQTTKPHTMSKSSFNNNLNFHWPQKNWVRYPNVTSNPDPWSYGSFSERDLHKYAVLANTVNTAIIADGRQYGTITISYKRHDNTNEVFTIPVEIQVRMCDSYTSGKWTYNSSKGWYDLNN
jgi:hypothetical protein